MNNEAFNKAANSHALFKKTVAPLKRLLGVSFGYMIVFKDGHYYTLMDNLRCLREFVTHANKGSIFCDRNITDYFDGEYSFTLWPLKPVDIAMKIYYKHNAYSSGITISKTSKDTIELYWFTKKELESDQKTFFIRNKQVLLEFINYFNSYKPLLLLPSTRASQSLFKFSNGFEAYIPKPENTQELYKVRKLINILRSESIPESMSTDTLKLEKIFSPRENEILPMICRGFTTKIIAQKLGISIKTVNTHIEHIKQKAGLRFKTDIINFYENFFHKTTM